MTPTREQVAEVIAMRKAEHDRMPEHWVDRRLAIMADIDALVDDWLDTEE